MKNQALKDTLAAARKAHFAAGGTAKTWIMPAKALGEDNPRARKSKEACRKPLNED